MDTHPYGWLSLVPSFVAIVLAIATRRVVLSMLLGIFSGALITNQWHVFKAIGDTVELHLWRSLAQDERLRVFAFTILMGSMVGIIHRCGGMHGLVDAVWPLARSRRRGQIIAWCLGMMVFFDDYANTVLLGQTLQPLCRRLKISREKLAYVVDSTAAPVAGLALISTWVAGEISYVQDGLNAINAPDSANAFQLFVSTIPYRFYVILALVFVLLVAATQRDFGPMWKAERDAQTKDQPTHGSNHSQSQPKHSGWWNAVIPVVVTVGAVLAWLYQTGTANLGADHHDMSVSLWEVFGSADSYSSLLWGSIAGLAASVVMVMAQRLLSWKELSDAAKEGARFMLPALAVLWLASALSALTGNKPLDTSPAIDPQQPFAAKSYRLYTGEFLAGLITPERTADKGDDETDNWWLRASLPTIVFLLSACISFATGTSWGTMAIVMPITIPLAYGAVATGDGSWIEHPIVICTVGSVLAGAIFGDHCSPISDTTILSSQSSGCDHAAHVWTQLPYALVVGAVSIALGTIPVGLGISVWLLLPLSVAAMLVGLLLFGRRSDG